MKKKRKKERTKKILKNLRNENPCHSLFSEGIICGPHRGSFAVRDHLRSNLGIISGQGIICGRGSFAALYRSGIISVNNSVQAVVCMPNVYWKPSSKIIWSVYLIAFHYFHTLKWIKAREEVEEKVAAFTTPEKKFLL